MKTKTTKTWWAVLGVPALLALAACTADAGEDTQKPAEEVKAKAAEGQVAPQMKPDCMVNDDSTEAICCSPSRCWYVDLTDSYDPYADR